MAIIVKSKKKEPVKVTMSATIRPATLQALRKMAKASNTSVSEVMGSLLDFAIKVDKTLQTSEFDKDLQEFLEPFVSTALKKKQEEEQAKQGKLL
jgi:hypothetical protein